jgi:hypothetical protein
VIPIEWLERTEKEENQQKLVDETAALRDLQGIEKK